MTIDCLLPAEDVDPDVLQIYFIEMEAEEGSFADGAVYAN